jgi:hypothetical protein
MATKAQITAEQYLDMTFEYDAEFVGGRIVERSWPNMLHLRAQAAAAVPSPSLPHGKPFELTPSALFNDL